ncbi:hypothetical protein DFQ26_003792 [Actinomortierella ambigua]|nr:hypothetical protein DFQ26_003792 [Actinomortierella ambigua]
MSYNNLPTPVVASSNPASLNTQLPPGYHTSQEPMSPTVRSAGLSDAGKSGSTVSPTDTLPLDAYAYHNNNKSLEHMQVVYDSSNNVKEWAKRGGHDDGDDDDDDDDNKDGGSGSASEEGVVGLAKTESTLIPLDPNSKEIRRLRRKVDRHLMPLLTLMYLCAYLDRANIGNAKVFNMEKDLNISGSTFSWGLSIFYFAYVLGEIPSSILVKKVGPALWVSMVIALWGAVMMSMAFLRNGAGLLTARFFLGIFESGFAPAPVVIISLWYPRLEHAFRIGVFFSAATVAGACAGLIAYGIARMDGVLGMKSWSWIFLLEGAATVVVAAIAYFTLPNLPETSTFLTDREKFLTIERLRRDAGPATQTHFSWKQFWMVFKDPKTYVYTLILTLHSPALASLGVFVPSIVRGLNFSPVRTQLMTVPIWSVACIATLSVAISSDRLKGRGSHAIACVSAAFIGYILLIVIPEDNLVGRYLSLTLCASGIYACLPILLSWPSANVGGHTKRSVTVGTVIGGQIGSAVGGQIYRDDDAPRYIRGHSICAGLLAVELVLIITIRWYLMRQNTKRQNMSAEEYMRASQGEELCDDHPDFRFVP